MSTLEQVLLEKSSNGLVEAVQALIEAGANVDATNNNGTTALMLASRSGHCEVVNALLEAEADVDATSNCGWTALMSASRYGHCEVVEALLGAQVDVDATNNNGWTPLMLASRYGHCEVVEALLGAQVDVDATNNHGSTALMLASENGHRAVVDALENFWDSSLFLEDDVETIEGSFHYKDFYKNSRKKGKRAIEIAEGIDGIDGIGFHDREALYSFLSQHGYTWNDKHGDFIYYDYNHPPTVGIILQVRSASAKVNSKTHKYYSGIHLQCNSEKILILETFILEKIKSFFNQVPDGKTQYGMDPPHAQDTALFIKGDIKDTIGFSYRLIEELKPEATLLSYNERSIRYDKGFTEPYIDLIFYWPGLID